ncbi:MAG: anhydro-N-acetylmuramic acid kinase [Leptolyngbya sp. SIO4C1]|nr:anhydro-N-acetylmuramic acid kinase [Leptolyngbya sp. SIO4C1]
MKIVGLMSGTSVDGIDAALVEVSGQGYAIEVELLAAQTYPYPQPLRSQILSVCAGQPLSLAQLARLDDAIARVFAEAAQSLAGPRPTLVASHGQTVYHRPPMPAQLGYTLQLGRGALIAEQTGLPTISNFRAADMALGGQGAPLVPPVDACLLSHPQRHRCVQNIGGIGNVAYLPAWERTDQLPERAQGWDTGPGNVLIDWAVSEFTQGQQRYDANGRWAAQGKVCTALVEQWLAHPFFQLPPPKSTGRELFGADYAQQCWQQARAQALSQADFIATLSDFTAASIEQSYRRFLPQLPDEVLVGGGGSHNPYLLNRLRSRLPEVSVTTTDDAGLSADYKEAIAFAILGFWRWHQLPGNLPTATGAARACLLGEISLPATGADSN